MPEHEMTDKELAEYWQESSEDWRRHCEFMGEMLVKTSDRWNNAALEVARLKREVASLRSRLNKENHDTRTPHTV